MRGARSQVGIQIVLDREKETLSAVQQDSYVSQHTVYSDADVRWHGRGFDGLVRLSRFGLHSAIYCHPELAECFVPRR